jgi:hypothetical protein
MGIQLVRNTKTTLLEQSSIIYFRCCPECLIVCQPRDNLITTQLSFDYLQCIKYHADRGGGDFFLLVYVYLLTYSLVKNLWGNIEAYLW